MRFRRNKLRTVDDVAAWQLCCGCGACSSGEGGSVEMIDTLDHGRRPVVGGQGRGPADEDLRRRCPGIDLQRIERPPDQPGPDWVYRGWGPVLGVWEGHATDRQVRFRSASGGIATALALHAIERAGLHGVLHTHARADAPLLNRTAFSTDRRQVLAGAGSRYAPASPCDGLGLIEQAPGPCMVVGKPCDVAGASKAASCRPALAANLALTVAFFCAGTPTTRGTLAMLQAMGVQQPDHVRTLRYRGHGWPGAATVEHRDAGGQVKQATLTYEQSWGEVLSKHRQWRCFICPDHIGEYADIAVADAWHRSTDEHQPGRSVVIARTQRGLRFVQSAMEGATVELEQVSPEILPRCRPGQARAQGELWARLATLRALGIPVPTYRGFGLFGHWRKELGPVAKARSVLSTVKRVMVKKLYRRRNLTAYAPNPANSRSEQLMTTSG